MGAPGGGGESLDKAKCTEGSPPPPPPQKREKVFYVFFLMYESGLLCLDLGSRDAIQDIYWRGGGERKIFCYDNTHFKNTIYYD